MTLKQKIGKKKRRHFVSIIVLSFLIAGNLFSINSILAAPSTSTNACLSICETGPCPPCSVEYCGDLVVNNGEICDGNNQGCMDGFYVGSQLCNFSCDGWGECVLSESCGDGTLNGSEVCDDGNNEDCDACRSDCTREDDVCGDGYLECEEECDTELGLSSSYRCSSECTLEIITSSAPIFFISKEAELEIDEIIPGPDEEDVLEEKKKEDVFIELMDIGIDGVYFLKNRIQTDDLILESNNASPVFSGKLSIAYSYMYFQINEEKTVSGSVQADKNGNWTWQAPTSLDANIYKMYISVGDRNNKQSNIYYTFDFRIRGEAERDIQEEVVEIISEPIIKKVEQEEINEIKEFLNIYSSLSIDNSNELSSLSRLFYTFDLKSNPIGNVRTNLFLRIKNNSGETLIEEKKNIGFRDTYTKKDYILIPENFEEGIYFLESFLNVDDYIIFNKAQFKVTSKEGQGYWSMLNTSLYKKDLMLGLLTSTLLIFMLILFFETRALRRLKNISEVDGSDLENQII